MFKVIFGMAEDRKQILFACDHYRDAIAEHVIKCLAYGNTTGDLNHWIYEITSWLKRINNMKPKKGFKIKPQQYKETLFAGIGDELSDVENDIGIFQDLHVMAGEYPEFEITDKLCKDVFNCYYELADKICSRLGTFQNRNEITDAVRSTIMKYTH